MHHQRPHCQIDFTCLFVACFQIIFKFVVDRTTKKPREALLFFLDSVTVNTVVHTESEACQKQWVSALEINFIHALLVRQLTALLPLMALYRSDRSNSVALVCSPVLFPAPTLLFLTCSIPKIQLLRGFSHYSFYLALFVSHSSFFLALSRFHSFSLCISFPPPSLSLPFFYYSFLHSSFKSTRSYHSPIHMFYFPFLYLLNPSFPLCHINQSTSIFLLHIPFRFVLIPVLISI